MVARQETSAEDSRPGRTGGRAAQRRRTRAAIVAATRRLIAAGATPSIDDIAAAADVSRRTVYMYFPTVDQLLLDATVGLLSETSVDAVLDEDAHGDDVVARVDALAAALLRLAPQTLPLGRKIVALTAEARADDTARRGQRRLDWIERAVEPLRGRLPDDRHERLVSGLAVLLGWEAMIVLRDVCRLDPAREADAIRWAARALVQAALAEADR